MAELVAAYFAYQQTHDDELRWAWEAVDTSGFDDPQAKWTQIRALLDAAPDDWAIGLLAAGPLEDLLRFHGLAILPAIAQELPGNARLRQALSGVWLTPGATSDQLTRLLESPSIK